MYSASDVSAASVAPPAPRRRALPVIGLVAFVAGAVVAPQLLDRHGVAILVSIFFWASFSSSWNIIGGYAGQFSLGHAAFFAVGAYASAWTYRYLGLSPLVGLALGVLVAGLAAAALGAIVFRYKLLGTYFAIGTLAFSEILRVTLGNVSWFGGSGGIPIPLAPEAPWTLLQFQPVGYYYLFLALTLAYMLLCWWIGRSRFGFQLAVVRDNEDVAETLGVRPESLKLRAFVLSAMTAAPVGTIYAQYVMFVEPQTFLSFSMVIQVVIPAVIGGLGTVFGPVLGAALLTLVIELTSELAVRPGFSLFAYGCALMVFPLLVPSGIWPLIRDFVARRGR